MIYVTRDYSCEKLVKDTLSLSEHGRIAQGEDYSKVKNLIGRLDDVKWFEHYVPDNFTNYWQHLDYFAVDAKMPEQHQAPLAYIQPTIQATEGMTDREKVTYLNDYLCTLLAYKKGATAGVTRIFASHDNELEAACGSYAVAFKFLCGAADIPCFTIGTTNHVWNMVYADGQWLHVDVSTNDGKRQMSYDVAKIKNCVPFYVPKLEQAQNP